MSSGDAHSTIRTLIKLVRERLSAILDDQIERLRPVASVAVIMAAILMIWPLVDFVLDDVFEFLRLVSLERLDWSAFLALADKGELFALREIGDGFEVIDAHGKRWLVDGALPYEIARALAESGVEVSYAPSPWGFVAGRLIVWASGAAIIFGVWRVANRLCERIARKPKAAEAPQRPPATPEELYAIAIHEAGHALLGHLAGCDMEIATITPVPGSLGRVTFKGHRWEPMSMTRRELEQRIAVLLGGREAERLMFGDKGIRLGSSNDLSFARAIASRMVQSEGMGRLTGPLNIDEADASGFHQRCVERDMREIIEAARVEAAETLAANRSALLAIAYALIARNTISADDVAEIVANPGMRSDRPDATQPAPTRTDEAAA